MTYRKATLRGVGGEISFSTAEPASAQAVCNLRDVKGWYGGVGVTDSGGQRELGHGEFPQRRRRTGRTITLEGSVIVTDPSVRDDYDVLLSGLLGSGQEGVLTVVHGDREESVIVELDGEISHAYKGPLATVVSIPLLAPDPFKYGPRMETTLHPPGSATGLKWGTDVFSAGYLRWGGESPVPVMANSGNSEAWPVFTVYGEFPSGFTIRSGRNEITWPLPVTPRAPVSIDSGNGQVLVSGRDMQYALGDADWFAIPARGSLSPQLIPGDTHSEGWAVVTWSPTSI